MGGVGDRPRAGDGLGDEGERGEPGEPGRERRAEKRREGCAEYPCEAYVAARFSLMFAKG